MPIFLGILGKWSVFLSAFSIGLIVSTWMSFVMFVEFSVPIVDGIIKESLNIMKFVCDYVQ